MSDITMIFGLLVLLGVGLGGMLVTWWLLFPRLVDRARQRVERTPWATFFLGLLGAGAWALPPILLLALPGGPAKLLGAAGILSGLLFATLGAAGIAAHMGNRLGRLSAPETLQPVNYLRGVAALVLAAAVPILGWFLFTPLALFTSMGAAIFAVLHWVPRPAPRPAAQPVPDSSAVQSG